MTKVAIRLRSARKVDESAEGAEFLSPRRFCTPDVTHNFSNHSMFARSHCFGFPGN